MTGTHQRKEFKGGAKPATLLAGITDTDTSLVVQSAVGWPDGTAGPFVVCIDRGTSLEEKMLCSSRTNNQINIVTRGYDDTTAVAHSTTTNAVEHVLDASTLDQANRYVNLQAAKGDMVVHNGTNPANLTVGANGTVLKANASAASGVEWGTIGADQLGSTGVTAGTYGDGDSVVQLTVDADGRITSASNVNIALAMDDVTGLSTALTGKSNTDHAHSVQSHTHDYSASNHNHDTDYAGVHSHPYASDSHNHNTVYAVSNHDHDGDYVADFHGTHVGTMYMYGTADQVGVGKLHIGAPTHNGDGQIKVACTDANNTNITVDTQHGGLSGQYYVFSIYHNGVNKGSISHNGSTTSYNTTSDYRIKENVIDLTDGLDVVNSLTPRRFTFKNNDTDQRVHTGFIAHELQAVMPELVIGEKDAVDEHGDVVPQVIDKQGVVAVLVSAVQELSKEVEALKAQLKN
jgi:hypothetical protein